MEKKIAKQLKVDLYNKIQAILDERIEQAKSAIASAKQSRDNDTKSSAGDKYETGRAMMQQEMDKNEAQLSKTLLLKKTMALIDPNLVCETIELGSLVITDSGIYFMSIGLGAVDVGKEKIYSVSLVSPIGKFLHQKVAGEQVTFQGRTFSIEHIT